MLAEVMAWPEVANNFIDCIFWLGILYIIFK